MTPNDPLTVLRHALDQAHERVREAEADADKFQRAIAILSGEDEPKGFPRLVHGTTRALLKPTETTESAAMSIIRAAGRPLRLREIAESMISSGFRSGDLKRVRTNIRKPLERSKKIRNLGDGLYTLVVAP